MKNLKQYFYFLLFITVFTIVGCKKDDNSPNGNNNNNNNNNQQACQTSHYGSLMIVSILRDPYEVYIDNAYKGLVGATSTVTFAYISSGTHATKYIQHSGYVLYPTQYTASTNISDCNISTVTLQ